MDLDVSTHLDIGQTIICGISGLTLLREEKIFLSKNKIGGVVLFSRNYKNPKQLVKLVNSLKKIDSKMFIAVDYEGGSVQRFRDYFTLIPHASILGSGKPKDTFEIHKIAAKELKAVGINLNFSPCADIYKSGSLLKTRSFGRDKIVVAKHALSVIKAMQSNGILACAKHFPGHGITSLDTHSDLPKSSHTLKTLKTSLYPFKLAISNNVAMIMLAHIILKDSNNLPVSLSEPHINFLRNVLKYKGLIITDDLKMDAMQIDDENIPQLFFSAGGDILLTRSLEQADAFITSMRRYKIIPKNSIHRILAKKISVV